MLVEEIVSQEEAQGLPSSELDAVENQLKWASWELHSLRHCGEDQDSGLEGGSECGSSVQDSSLVPSAAGWGGGLTAFTRFLRHRYAVGSWFFSHNHYWFADLRSFILRL